MAERMGVVKRVIERLSDSPERRRTIGVAALIALSASIVAIEARGPEPCLTGDPVPSPAPTSQRDTPTLHLELELP